MVVLDMDRRGRRKTDAHTPFDAMGRAVCSETRGIGELVGGASFSVAGPPGLRSAYRSLKADRLAAFGPCLDALNKRSAALARKGLMRRGSVLSLPVLKRFMKIKKVPHECHPCLLSGKRRWRLFHWISRRTRRDGARNNYLSQIASSA